MCTHFLTAEMGINFIDFILFSQKRTESMLGSVATKRGRMTSIFSFVTKVMLVERFCHLLESWRDNIYDM